MSHTGTDVALAGLFKRRPGKPPLKHATSMASALGPAPDATATPALVHHRSEGGVPSSKVMGSDPHLATTLPPNSSVSLPSRPQVESTLAKAAPVLSGVDSMPQPVKFGDIICLWSAISDQPAPGSNAASSSQSHQTHHVAATPASMLELGVVGLFDVDAVRPNNLTLHKCDALVCVALPSEPHFTPSYFRVLPECYYAHLKLGSPVSYGDVVVLMDVDDKVWNNKIGFEFNGHFAPTDKLNRPGEMTIAFVRPTAGNLQPTTDPDALSASSSTTAVAPGSTNTLDSHHESTAGLYYGEPKPDGVAGPASSGRVVCYGDDNVLVQVVDSNRLRLGFNQILTRFRKKSTPVIHGAYLRCDGRGTTLRVTIQPPPAPVAEAMWVLSTTPLPHDTRTPVEVPEHKDLTGLAVTVTGALPHRLHIALGDSFGSVDILLAKLHAKAGHEPWTVDVVQPTAAAKTSGRHGPTRRPIQLVVQTTTSTPLAATDTSQRRAIALTSTMATYGIVLALVGLYVVAVVTGEITASTAYGTVLLWAKPMLPLAWVVRSWWVSAQPSPDNAPNAGTVADTVVTVQLTVVSWSVVSDFSATPTDPDGSSGIESDKQLEGRPLEFDEEAPGVPRSFIVAEFGNVAKAQARYNETLAWRKDHRMDDVLTTPQVHYHTIRRFYKQCVHKHDKDGHPVYIEKLGGIDLKGLIANGVTLADLFAHYLFNVEYIFNRVATVKCPCVSCKDSHTQKLCIVLDARGVGMRDLAGEVLEFVRGCTSVMQKHYPQRSLKIFVVNVPSWFGVIWKLVKPLLNETTRAKTSILSEADAPAALLHSIDAANLPQEYGGTCQCDGGGCFVGSAVQVAQLHHVDKYLNSKSTADRDDADDAPAVASTYEPTGLVKKKSSGEVCSLDAADSDFEESHDEDVALADAPPRTTTSSNESFQDGDHHKPRHHRRDKATVLHSGHLLMRLIRQKHFVNPIWLRRFVSLSPHHILVQKSPKDTPVKYVLTPGSYVRRTVPDKPNCFEVVMDSHSLLFYADSPEIRAEWLDALARVVDASPPSSSNGTSSPGSGGKLSSQPSGSSNVNATLALVSAA